MCVLALGVLFAGLPLAGQGTPDDRPRGPETVLQRLEAGQRLRVELLERRRLEGRFLALEEDQFTMREEGVVTVSLNELGGLWTRGNRVKAGALVGGGAGLVAGAIVGAWLGDFACAEGGEDCTLEAALALGGIGAAGGAGLGAVAGLLIPRWDQQWP